MEGLSPAGCPASLGALTSRAAADRTAIAIWAGLIVATAAWGAALLAGGTGLFIGAPPLFGHLRVHASPGVVLAIAAAAAIVLAGPSLARRLSFRRLLLATALGAALWPLALAMATGAGTINHPLENPGDYLPVLPFIHSPGQFLSTFVDRIATYPTHVKGHPPGMVLILWGLARVGLGGTWAAALLIVGIASTAPVAALLAARSVSGEALSRRAAPFLVLTPAAVWIATSADALYMGVGAWAVSLLVLAIEEHRPHRRDALALAGGVVYGVTCFLSFGLVLLGLIPLALAVRRRRLRPLAPAVLGTLLVFAAFLAAGYWWLDGFLATRTQYYDGVASSRPYSYFLFADLGAFAIATGPALAVALGRLRDGRLWILVGGCALALLLADVSGMSKAEVERIWLPFTPWMLLATAALPRRLAYQRRMLVAQAGLALVLQVVLVTSW